MTDSDAAARTGPSRGDGRDHAVVLGAGIAGILAARVLTDTFRAVTVIDRDDLVDMVPRRGVPQGRHLHGLMDSGRQIMEELFPGVTEELIERGATLGDVLVNTRWYLAGLRAQSTSAGLNTILASRPFLETILRARLAALPTVQLCPRTAAVGLVEAPGHPRRIVGVRVTRGGTDDGQQAPESGDVINADLVVDATGRGSRAPDWLAALGEPRPAEERVDIDACYTTRIYRRKPEHLDGDVAVNMTVTPGLRGAAAVAIEDDRWLVTLGGTLGDHPPHDEAGFLAYARTLPSQDIHDLLMIAEPLTDPVPYRIRGSRRRYYERTPTPPEGFIAIGDALCGLNPVYAQGMTTAAQEARVLQRCLASSRPGLPGRFYREAGRVVDTAWQTSTGADLAHPAVEGRRTTRGRLMNAYVKRMLIASHVDPVVARTFMRQMHMVDPRSALLRPGMVFRILRRGKLPAQ
ncbi:MULTISPECIES: NAD(P)/FAD-dependent oxidoreductase [unclassified Pseudofrankia]|uniref:FAD-dependent oxidoreductase n=1 Tax=unclassified Pseudofrankia TaxID=2994372 RepID=UPI0008DA1D06|nr:MULTISPECIES: FAD-dependent oxidoreductase [unclassified Pseudofrankia]MDT3443229.1 FAD-dependent oxidoreductase [Pseudofrankia sp. BMG5.37]OHV62736.1 FAD-dependent oxidoreductase [Pseudofrankia sp. BMG5.36]